MIHYHDDNFLFEVSILEATFSDDVTIHDGNVTVKEKTPLGKEVWIVSTARAGSSREQTIHDDDDAVVDHIIVRLIFITPEQD